MENEIDPKDFYRELDNLKKLEKEKQRSSSTSSIHLSSTIIAPNPKHVINSIATVLLSQIIEDEQLGKVISQKSDLYYFSEDKYITEYPLQFDDTKKEATSNTPSLDDISEFIEALFNCAQFSIECCILSLIYINRVIALTGLSINPKNWRPLILVSLMIAQKVWDDKYLCNADFAYIYPFFDTTQLNMLEMKFLEMIQYNVYVKMSLYTKYYFELKTLFPSEYQEKPANVGTINGGRDFDSVIESTSDSGIPKETKRCIDSIIKLKGITSSPSDHRIIKQMIRHMKSKSTEKEAITSSRSVYVIN